MTRRRYVSIKEVAARAGVSFQTASKVLNGGDVRVSAETEERILAAAAELGYRPNTIARSLVQRATATIGLVASDATDVAIALASVAAEQAARKHGHSVLVGHLAAGGTDGADIVRTLIERRVDGIIAAAPEVEEDTAVADLLRRYVPSVSLQAVPGGGVPLVGSNHRETGRLAADHLLGLGHTSIGTVTGLFRRRVTRSRLHGYEDALRDAGLEPSEDLVAEGDWTPQGGATATRLLLEHISGLTAIFVHSDVMAIGVLSALARPVELGFRYAYGPAVFFCSGPGSAVAARVAEDAAAEHDEHLLRRAEVAVPAAFEEQAAQGFGQFARTIGRYLQFDDRPELRLPGLVGGVAAVSLRDSLTVFAQATESATIGFAPVSPWTGSRLRWRGARGLRRLDRSRTWSCYRQAAQSSSRRSSRPPMCSASFEGTAAQDGPDPDRAGRPRLGQ